MYGCVLARAPAVFGRTARLDADLDEVRPRMLIHGACYKIRSPGHGHTPRDPAGNLECRNGMGESAVAI